MKTQDFYFELPKSLIAQYPLKDRHASKMLVYEKTTQSIRHEQFKQLSDYLKPGDILVLNNTKVIPARLFGHKSSGGAVELLVERMLSETEFLAHIRTSKAPKPGAVLLISENIRVIVEGKSAHLYRCVIDQSVSDTLHAANNQGDNQIELSATLTLESVLENFGHVPLPPYIQRKAEPDDKHRYQTIYAKTPGSVAAPTAGLHFDASTLSTLVNHGVELAYTTLHVGAGTFQPVRSTYIADHRMHAEHLEISDELAHTVNLAKSEGRRVIAVGSTALRALESAAQQGQLKSYVGETSIFITPGYQFQIVDGLITNFHLPESTLLMMVSAFIGYDEMMRLYQSAIEHGYRFFSYGDVSLLI